MDFQTIGDKEENSDFIIFKNKKIGEGAYGVVYECEKKSNSNAKLCAKIIKVQNGTELYSQREEQIINKLSSMKNVNLVQAEYCKYYQNKQTMYVIMEKCPSSLQTEIINIKDGKRQQFSEEEVYDFFTQIMNGYKTLYESHIVHRDIKPDNILISEINQIKTYKISDFGIGKICDGIDMGMTKIGTPVYASPECNSFIYDDFSEKFENQKKAGVKNYKSKADVYSFGVMMYQIAFGLLPFEVKSPEYIITFINNLKHKKFSIPDAQKQKFKNQAIFQLIEKMIVYNPEERIGFLELFTLLQMQVKAPQKVFQKNNNPPSQNPQVQFTNGFQQNTNRIGTISHNNQQVQVPVQQQMRISLLGPQIAPQVNVNFQQPNQQQGNVNPQQQQFNISTQNKNFQQLPNQQQGNANVQQFNGPQGINNIQQQFQPQQGNANVQQFNVPQQGINNIQQQFPLQQGNMTGQQFNVLQQGSQFSSQNANPTPNPNFPINQLRNTMGVFQQIPQKNSSNFSTDSTQQSTTKSFDPIIYLEQRLNENIKCYCGATQAWHKKLISSIKEINISQLQTMQNDFFNYFEYNPGSSYSLNYLQFIHYILTSMSEKRLLTTNQILTDEVRLKDEISKLYKV